MERKRDLEVALKTPETRLCVFNRQPRGQTRMRRGFSARGSLLAGDKEPSEDASTKSTDTSSWPPTWDNRPTAHIAEILSGRQHISTSVAAHLHQKLSFFEPAWLITLAALVCDLIGVCWGSRDTSVRVSTFPQPCPNFSCNMALYLLLKPGNMGEDYMLLSDGCDLFWSHSLSVLHQVFNTLKNAEQDPSAKQHAHLMHEEGCATNMW